MGLSKTKNRLWDVVIAAAAISLVGCGASGLLPGPADDGAVVQQDDVDGGGGGVPDLVYAPVCGNGIKDPGEQCDKGSVNNTHGSGCEPDCTLTCIFQGAGMFGDAQCDDGDDCNGKETCGMDNNCHKGQPLADGATCAMAKICHSMVCGDIICGDGLTSAGEECDDGAKNGLPGDGCDKACHFVCVSKDPNRNCALADVCQGMSACNDMTHLCSTPMPLPEGTVCAMGKVCRMGACTATVCGNGILEQGEACDNGMANGPGAGCEKNCTFSCVNPANDCKAMVPVCQKWTCDGNHVCLAAADGTKDGTMCANGGALCKAGTCVAPGAVCGNGKLEMGEQCDFGMGNGAGTGCEANCTFSCAMNNPCPNNNPCLAAPTCAPVMVNGAMGQKCQAGMNLVDGTNCGMAKICVMGTCKASVCGDGLVDKAIGEQCEPPNTMVCDAKCLIPAVCGNGKREGAEQCDDGNLKNLDGCDATCNFEQDQRINYLKIQWNTDAYCAANALGGAVVNNIAQGQLQPAIDTGISGGTTNVLFQMLGLTDLTGVNQAKFNIGVLNGPPVMGANYNGTADVDWWYTGDVMGLDMARKPLALLTASLANRVLNAGPGTINLVLVLTGAPATFKISNVKVQGTVNATSTPKVSANMSTPGHLASENLDPKLVSYESMGQGNANGAAKLCGNIAAASLAKVALPAAVIQNCNQYNAQNTMLDLLVGGCTAFGFITLVKATQPDQVDPNAPVAGAGAPYKLSATVGKAINTCKDKAGAVVNLATCLDAAAYSSYFKFTTDRVIIK